MPLSWRDILDTIVKMLLVIGLVERQHPLTYRAQRFKDAGQSMDVTADNVIDFARTLNSGVDALGKCIRLERQAFGLDTDTPQEESRFQQMTMEELDAEINTLIEKRSAPGG